MGVDLDAWLAKVKDKQFLAEDELKALCEYVSPSAHTSLFQKTSLPSAMLHLALKPLEAFARGFCSTLRHR